MSKSLLERQIENAARLEKEPNFFPVEKWKLLNIRLRLSRIRIEISILEDRPDSDEKSRTMAYLKKSLAETEADFEAHKIAFPD